MPDIFVSLISLDSSPPVISNRFPAPNATDVDVSTNVSFDVVDQGGNTINVATISVSINSVDAIIDGVFQAGFTGSLTPISNGFSVTINQNDSLPFNSAIEVFARAGDTLALPNVVTDTWSFTTVINDTGPVITNHYPTGVYVSRFAHIGFDVTDASVTGVDFSSISVEVNGQFAFQNGSTQNGYITVVTTLPDGFRFDIAPPVPWQVEQVSVTVTASDTAP